MATVPFRLMDLSPAAMGELVRCMHGDAIKALSATSSKTWLAVEVSIKQMFFNEPVLGDVLAAHSSFFKEDNLLRTPEEVVLCLTSDLINAGAFTEAHNEFASVVERLHLTTFTGTDELPTGDLLRRALAGNKKARDRVAYGYANGANGFPPNPTELLKLADQGWVKAQELVTEGADGKYGFTRDRIKLLELANQGCIYAQELVSEGYTLGWHGFPKSSTLERLMELYFIGRNKDLAAASRQSAFAESLLNEGDASVNEDGATTAG